MHKTGLDFTSPMPYLSNYFFIMKPTKLFFLFLLLLHNSIFSQQICFYNVENLFDPSNDSLKKDDDFTPTGSYHWSYSKYYKKVNNIAKVFVIMGKGKPPAIIGVAEIENETVLKRFCYHSPLKKYDYHYVHFDSPDQRGVDVGLLYRKDEVTILDSKPVRVIFPFDTSSKNRDILYVLTRLMSGDTIHIFVNHWTSRFGGLSATIPKRNYYASLLKELTDSIFAHDKRANILIMGDFNDYPEDESMHFYLQVGKVNPILEEQKLYNLMLGIGQYKNTGTHKHEDFWGCLDQFVVSTALLKKIKNKEAVIFKSDFMMVPDEKYGGDKVYRTFLGPRYIGGFSDHLPIYITFEQEKGRFD